MNNFLVSALCASSIFYCSNGLRFGTRDHANPKFNASEQPCTRIFQTLRGSETASVPADQSSTTLESKMKKFRRKISESTQYLKHSTSLNSENLPLPHDTFTGIIKGKKVYIDKTAYLKYILDKKYILLWLTRPRRFGKSLFLQMMESFFLGERYNFENLYIFEYGNDEFGNWIKYPVIYLDFSDLLITDSVGEFKRLLINRLVKIASTYSVNYSAEDFQLVGMLEDLEKQYNAKVVILIDEYDLPVKNALYQRKDKKLAEELQVFLNSFFAIIKSNVKYLKLVFVTGTSKLAVNSLYSGANSFVDLSLEEEFATAMGLTTKEISNAFKPYFTQLVRVENIRGDELLKELLHWYDGYQFSKNPELKVCNPISVVACLREQKVGPYWTSTGSINTIVDKFKKQSYHWDIYKDYLTTGEEIFATRDILRDEIPLPVEMFTYGYLTIKAYNPLSDSLTLDYPNKEVEDFMKKKIRWAPNDVANTEIENMALRAAFMQGDLQTAVDLLNQRCFSTLTMPDQLFEGSLTSILASYLRSNHVPCEGTVKMIRNKQTEGDLDLQTTDLNPNYVIEVKCVQYGDQQIIDKFVDYSNKPSFREAFNFQDKVFLLGLTFKRNNRMEPFKINSWLLIPFVHPPKDPMLPVSSLQFDEFKSSNPNTQKYISKYTATNQSNPVSVLWDDSTK